jgi:hypothetical protein
MRWVAHTAITREINKAYKIVFGISSDYGSLARSKCRVSSTVEIPFRKVMCEEETGFKWLIQGC